MTAKLDIDLERLKAWVAQNCPEVGHIVAAERFSGGQSNPTYRLSAKIEGHKTEGQACSWVLRRKPFGELLPSAHAVEREYRVIKALNQAHFPTPKAVALCEAPEVIGAHFYLMSHLEGRIFWDGALPSVASPERALVYEAMIDRLAELHNLEPEAMGLGDFGRAGNYFERQIDRWIKQYRASQTDEISEIEALIPYLQSTTPSQGRVSIVHGDYRIDNMVFDPSRPEIIGLLDWELSTLGDPLADLTYFCMAWIQPAEKNSGLLGLDLKALGIPALEPMVERYCKATGRSEVPPMAWYFAYNLFRLTAILQGVKKRAIMGNASSPKALLMAEKILPFAQAALGFAEKSGLSPRPSS